MATQKKSITSGSKKVIPLVTSWSFSRYNVYKLCPAKYKYSSIDKIKEPPNPAMARGDELHKAAEAYIKGVEKKLHPELVGVKKDLDIFKKMFKKDHESMVVEDTWAFTKEWDTTYWNDWVGCWLRVKLDLAYHIDNETLEIRDWKSGKFRPEMNEEYVEQLELYACVAFLMHEHIQKVIPKLHYVDEKTIWPPSDKQIIFTRKDLPKLKALWEKRVKPMFNDKSFAPRPNSKCQWCFYRKGNKAAGGGQCKY